MPVEYDLVIVGGSAIARYAAARAAQLQARVALIEPSLSDNPQIASLCRHTLMHIASIAQQLRQADSYGFDPIDPALDWQQAIAWAQGIAEIVQAQDVDGQSLERLAVLGVDVVLGEGAFVPSGFRVEGRILRSRRYLLAPAAQPLIPPIEGFLEGQVDYLTLDKFWQQPALPDRLIILGSNPQGIELAQALNRLGVQVTWVSDDRLLPQADPEVADLIQIQLETEGIRLLPQTQLQQIRQEGNLIELVTLDERYTADALLLATAPQLNLTSLNLGAIGVSWQPQGISVNRKLQTSNRRVYACGEALGGSPLFSLARYEATIALRNALFLPIAKVDYSRTPIALFTQPEAVSIGLTESAAKLRFREAPIVLRQFSKTLTQTQIHNDTTGFCKLILRQNGEILGAQWVGKNASEGIGTIALAMQQRLKVGAIAQLPLLSPTIAELLQQTAQQWKYRQPSQRRGWLDTWFSLRREWG
jgi:pyruvate/2-oxoglutarate dehydrogenase complex dihydrolipoamide dehydrogenase (E3) component